ncbi:Metabotropic glutamate receptor-like protein E [Hondaea fermentalgiana]|uniref:Metabotropic glutamate receptor-like protein E n=1 Tax=Hondaea fermentalgiana TaxID=2315210 RepID=A0A2R5GRB0_9STRA|nr:Metabotropic glutamate receptor-like protein E [Hondaea fermentalgiana]|eukprot:GBG32849.1 Metabotropic glutamate receptor-like protein E [Hondaea fermentalgiana]
MSQRILLAHFSLGVSALNASVIPRVLGVSSPNSSDCIVHNFLFYLSLTFILACLCAKEWRAWIVYERTKRFKQVKVRNRELFAVIGVVVAIMFIILLVGTILAPQRPDPCIDYRCSSSSNIFTYVAFGYVLLLTIATVVVAVLARNLNPVAGESTGILFTVGFVCFALVFLGILFATRSTPAYLETWLLSFSVSAISMVAMILIVFRKLSWINHSEAQIREKFLGGLGSSMGGSGSNPAETSDSYHSSQAARPVFSNSDHLPKPEPLYNPFGRYGGRFSDPGYNDETTSATGLSDEIYGGSRTSANESTVTFCSELQSAGTTFVIVSSAKLIALPFPYTDSSSGSSSGSGACVAHKFYDEDEFASPRGEDTKLQKQKFDIAASVENFRAKGFKIGEEGDWEEYLDRTTGDQYFINVVTGRFSRTQPSGDNNDDDNDDASDNAKADNAEQVELI